MQQKLADTERRCAMLAAQSSSQGTPTPAAAETFISRLLDIVADLYQQEQYSDLKVKVVGEQIHAHKFVLAARSDVWSLSNLASTNELDLSDCKPEVAMAMLRWTYTDELELSEDDAFLIDLMKLANRFQLQLLRERQVEELHTEFFDCTVDGSGVTFAKCITMPHM
uniref:BTB domain-containing protein n=1 Tax=Maylandia zebra TaxID=106582 RepID=A0A3P9D9F7_9CICH